MWDLILSAPDHCLSFYFMEAGFRPTGTIRNTTIVLCRRYGALIELGGHYAN